MLTIQHAAIFFQALLAKFNMNEAMELFQRNIPWVLLPDGIRAYVGPRQIFHFEKTPDDKDVSWGVFPESEVLELLTKENVYKKLEIYYPAEKYPKCVIGEQTCLETFGIHNYRHSKYSMLKIHLLQDRCMDNILRDELIDVSMRFSDTFKCRHEDRHMDGNNLRMEIQMFEFLGYIHLVGIIYQSHGILLNQAWFDEYVKSSLYSVYPKDLAETTYKFMQIPAWVEERINRDFSINANKCFGICGKALKNVFDQMYFKAFEDTFKNLY